ncbi:lipase family protein [Mycobacterium deserti]|uniref:Lipase family protein n=1 Tax=Mycobacterium deserti TaxID=2978347 RepID=A0ABT2MF50_9MYCO|nr:lipase family protein [Mycobacterium deserti]MCT7660897.1 lipase family protein [Mycobacterium deserti]
MTRRRRPQAALCALLALGLLIPGCTSENRPPKPSGDIGVDLRPDTTGAGSDPGALVAARTLPTVDLRLRSMTSIAARMEYTSTSGVDGSRTRVSGTVFVPTGPPPPGGWPVVVYGHPTTGISAECAPSASPTLLGASSTIVALVNARYVVTVPDYQGLGVDDSHHPYLDPISAGNNVIDAMRATRRLVPDVSDRWVGVGLSQGGQAVWAANELTPVYGAGLALLGTVSLAPPTDLTGFAFDAAAGTLTKQQQAALQLMLATLAKEQPDFNLDDYRRGTVAEKWDSLSSCDGARAAARVAALDKVTPDDLRPATPEAVAKLEGLLRARSLPQRPAVAPMLVIYGGRDELLPGPWTDRALAAACGMGDVIDIQFQPDKTHNDLDVSRTFGWIGERFAGLPAVNSCAATAPAQPPTEEPLVDPSEAEVTEDGAMMEEGQ